MISRSISTKLCRSYMWYLLPLFMMFPLVSTAATDYYASFLYSKGYLQEENLTIDGNSYECFRLLFPDLKPNDEAEWRKGAAQGTLQMIPNGTGGAVIAWNEGGSRVYLQSIDGAGNILWGPIAVKKAITRQDDYRLVADGDGGAFVVWQEARYDCDSLKEGKNHVVAQRFDSKGRGQWGPQGLSITGGASGAGPDIIPDGKKGGAIVIWHQLRSWSGDVAMFAQRVDRAGKKLWAAQGIEVSFAPTLPRIQGSAIVPSVDGGLVIVSTGVVSNIDTAVQRITSDGKHLWSPPPRISRGNTNSPVPHMIPDASGGAIIAMTPDLGNGKALVMRLDGRGSLMWDVTLAPGDHQMVSGIVSDGNGGAIVVWGKRRLEVVQFTYFAQRISANGQVQWKEDVMLGSASNGELASVAADGSGGVIAAWRTFQPLRGKNWPAEKKVQVQDVYVQRVSATGGLPWKEPRLVAGNIGKTGATYPAVALASDGKNGAIVAWSDGRLGFDIAPMRPEDEGPETGDPQVSGFVHAQHITSSGETAWKDNGIDISSRANDSVGCLERSSQTAVVAGFAVNLREQSNVSSGILLRLNRGAEVMVLGRKAACETIADRKGRWTRVQVPSASNKEGWIFDSFIVYPQHAEFW